MTRHTLGVIELPYGTKLHGMAAGQQGKGMRSLQHMTRSYIAAGGRPLLQNNPGTFMNIKMSLPIGRRASSWVVETCKNKSPVVNTIY